MCLCIYIYTYVSKLCTAYGIYFANLKGCHMGVCAIYRHWMTLGSGQTSGSATNTFLDIFSSINHVWTYIGEKTRNSLRSPASGGWPPVSQ